MSQTSETGSHIGESSGAQPSGSVPRTQFSGLTVLPSTATAASPATNSTTTGGPAAASSSSGITTATTGGVTFTYQHPGATSRSGAIDPLAGQVDLDNPYNNGLRIDHTDEPEITSSTVSDLTPPPPFYHGFAPMDDPATSGMPGELVVDNSGKLMLKYIREQGVIDDLIGAYDNFISEQMPMIMASRKVEVHKASGSYQFVFSEPRFELPAIPGPRPGDPAIQLLPRQARQELRTYSAAMTVKVEQLDMRGNQMIIGGQLVAPIRVKLCEVPVMLGSILDHLRQRRYTGKQLLEVGECQYDPFGYFIIRGDEKIILTQNKLRTNRILIYPDKEGDNIGIFTSKSILGHMPVEMYHDNDGTIRFIYYLLSSKKFGGKITIGKGNKNKLRNTVNILQIFRILGRNVPQYARDNSGDILLDDRGRKISVGRFDDLQKALTFIISFVDPNWQMKALMALQASYAEAVAIGDDYLSVYEKSTLKERHTRQMKNARQRGEAAPADPIDNWPVTQREINELTVEFIFTHMSLHHITPDYVLKRALEHIRKDPRITTETDIQQFLTPNLLRQIEATERASIINQKIILLGIMTARYLEVIIGKREVDDRDAIGNQRFVTGGQMMEQLFAQMWNTNIGQLEKDISKLARPTLVNIRNRLNKIDTTITNGFISAFNPNQWGPPGSNRAKQENVTDRLDRGEAQVAIYSHLLRINAPTNRRTKSPTVRSVKQSQIGYIGPVETPSGGAVGLVNNRAVTCWISVNQLADDVWRVMESNVHTNKNNDLGHVNMAMLNGEPKGWCNAIFLRHELVNRRRDGTIRFDTTIVIDEGVLNVYTDGGRPTKPVLIVDDDLPLIATRNMWTAPFSQLIQEGIVEYQDQWELKVHGTLAGSVQQLTFLRTDLIRNRNLLTQLITILNRKIPELITRQPPTGLTSDEINATLDVIVNGDLKLLTSRGQAAVKWLSTLDTFNNLIQRVGRVRLAIRRLEVKRYSHVDMDPTAILGVNASVIPLIDRNPGPRNAFQCGMAKQALGLNYSNPAHRFPTTARYLSYPSRPIVATQMQRLLGLDDMPSGNNVVVAIMTMDDNEEDAVVIKKEAIERGLFTYTLHHSSTIIIKREYTPLTRGTGGKIEISDRLVKPAQPFPGHKRENYDTIDERGLAIPDAVVNPGDCIVGAVRVITEVRRVREMHMGVVSYRVERTRRYEDISVYVKISEGGIVDKILVARTGEGDLSVTVRLRKTGRPIVGDKVATRQAQKSTIGRIVPESELPFTQRGLVPDIILNPHAIPKRMTMATLIELITSKYAALAGERVNGTVFRPFELDQFTELLQTLYGYNMYGNESMRSPITGETFPSQIMIGPAYYQLLKHQVSKKGQVRGGEGPRSMITGQAAKGKKRGGGGRFGENEVSGVLGHGASHFIQERMYTSSDPYSGTFCRSCNKVSVIDVVDERASCATCKSTDIGSCSIPRTFKAMTSYVSALGIRHDLFRSEDGEVPTHITERRLPPSPVTMPPHEFETSTASSSSSSASSSSTTQPPISTAQWSFQAPTTSDTVVVDTYDPQGDDDQVYDPRRHGVGGSPNVDEIFVEPNEEDSYEEDSYDEDSYDEDDLYGEQDYYDDNE